MQLFKKAVSLRNYLDTQRKQGKKIGFIPTMGALHKGHLSLITPSKNGDDISLCSIFVNPTQFNDPVDFQKYPVSPQKDIALLERVGCDLLFMPSVAEMYPQGTHRELHYDLGYLETILEGWYRPGHFQGVCKAVHRLLEMVKPDNLYIGQKDYQQCLVIKKLIELMGMKEWIRLHILPTLRESDGLAMSSRNRRLNEEERKKAATLYQTLYAIKKQLQKGELTPAKQQAIDSLIEKGFRVDYVQVADAGDLRIVEQWDGKQKLVALAAAHLGQVRLIDNILLN